MKCIFLHISLQFDFNQMSSSNKTTQIGNAPTWMELAELLEADGLVTLETFPNMYRITHIKGRDIRARWKWQSKWEIVFDQNIIDEYSGYILTQLEKGTLCDEEFFTINEMPEQKVIILDY
jgi:hypothetical protein